MIASSPARHDRTAARDFKSTLDAARIQDARVELLLGDGTGGCVKHCFPRELGLSIIEDDTMP